MVVKLNFMENIFSSLENVRKEGFLGFQKIGDLFLNCNSIPEKPGVYVVLYCCSNTPVFLDKGTGGKFKGRDPNVTGVVLASNWIKNTVVIYIGQAGGNGSEATLRKRLRQYLRFGQGAAVGHWGGRYIWQIKDSKNLVVCWKPCLTEDPRATEVNLIQNFRQLYGKMPFANIAS
jgi:hypothetical protein